MCYVLDIPIHYRVKIAKYVFGVKGKKGFHTMAGFDESCQTDNSPSQSPQNKHLGGGKQTSKQMKEGRKKGRGD